MLKFAQDNPNPDFWTVNTPPTERAIDEATGLVANRVIPNFKNRDNVLVVKVNGVEQYIVFNEKNERAVALVRNLKNMDVAEIGPFPPRERGWSPAPQQKETVRSVSPARAGMVPYLPASISLPVGFPRASGDGPYMA